MSADTITQYCACYPALAVQDLLKYLHQSCFGCEHLVSDTARAVAFIKDEALCAAQDRIGGIEKLDGPFCRVHLDVLSAGLSPETLGRLFVLSSEKEIGGMSALSEKLNTLRELSDRGCLPFSKDEVDAALSAWEKNGFSSCRHSMQFNAHYRPAYRVIAEEYVRYLPLLSEIDRRLEKGSLLLAIDGRCASGKTTLGTLLKKLYDCNLFHMDDFFLQPQQRTAERLAQPGENVDYERFLREVLLPASAGREFSYRRYDCHLQRLSESVTVPPKKLSVIEGVYSLHRTLSPYYDLKIFSDVSVQVQRERILKRNDSLAQRFFEEWIPLEERYFSECGIRDQADMLLL